MRFIPVSAFAWKFHSTCAKTGKLFLCTARSGFWTASNSCLKVLKVSQRQWRLLNFFNCSENFYFWAKKIRGNGYFPYSFLDSFEKFIAPFPDFGSSWINNLTGKVHITEDQYEKAKEIYDLMECKDFDSGDNHDLYLTLDVYLLADIFEAFRQVGLKEYQIDPAHFYSAPNFSWEGMLISTKVELGL